MKLELRKTVAFLNFWAIPQISFPLSQSYVFASKFLALSATETDPLGFLSALFSLQRCSSSRYIINAPISLWYLFLN